jgi:hypothetical protein
VRFGRTPTPCPDRIVDQTEWMKIRSADEVVSGRKSLSGQSRTEVVVRTRKYLVVVVAVAFVRLVPVVGPLAMLFTRVTRVPGLVEITVIAYLPIVRRRRRQSPGLEIAAAMTGTRRGVPVVAVVGPAWRRRPVAPPGRGEPLALAKKRAVAVGIGPHTAREGM